MNTILLSIFPLKGRSDYARVTLTHMEEADVPLLAPFTTSRSALAEMLHKTSIESVNERIMSELDQSSAVQMLISDQDALILFASTSKMEH